MVTACERRSVAVWLEPGAPGRLQRTGGHLDLAGRGYRETETLAAIFVAGGNLGHQTAPCHEPQNAKPPLAR